MATGPFNTQTKPRLADLEARLAAVEGQLLGLTDGIWNKWTFVSGGTAVQVDMAPRTYVEAALTFAAATALTSGTAKNIVSVVLPEGFRYKIVGGVGFTATGAGTHVVAYLSQGANGTSNTMPADKNDYTQLPRNAVLAIDQMNLITPRLVDLTAAVSPTTIYLVAQAGFGGGSGGISAWGWMRAEPEA